MNRKIWHKPLHKRKIWRQMPLYTKLLYYMHPFLCGLFRIWYQPLPFPTLFEVILSSLLIILIMLPILYPILIMALYYGAIQYIIESALDMKYIKLLDLNHNLQFMWLYEIPNETHIIFINLYAQRLRLMGILLTSIIDYIRLIYDVAITYY